MSVLAAPFARLSVALTLLVLAFSRISLVAHEFLGHGAPAVGLGGTITDYRLYLFAGGRINYDRAEAYSFAERLFISSGGIAVELGLALVAIILARRARPGSLLRVGLLAYATGNAVHATYYLAVGIHYEIADGAMWHHILAGPAGRWAVVVPLALLSGFFAFLGARAAFAQMWPQVQDTRRPWWIVAAALVVAVGIHAGLAVASLKLEPDRSYTALMRSRAQRKAMAAAARARAAMVRQGRAVDTVRVERIREATLERERPFPLRPFLVFAVLVGLVAGAAKRGIAPDSPGPWSWRSIAILGAILAVALSVVWMLRMPPW